jgi:uracil-DNA glycosylase family 4
MTALPVARERYPAVQHGAKCSECPLNGHKPVAPQRSTHPRLTVIVDAPGETEVVHGMPLVGAGGRLFDKALELENIPRDDLHITHAVLCRPPANFTGEQWKEALACCRPRLAAEIPQGVKVLALGNKSQATLSNKGKVLDWMGPPTPGIIWKQNGQAWKPLRTRPEPPDDAIHFEDVEFISTFNPAFCLANPQYNPILRKHIRRAWDNARGKLTPWVWPTEVLTDGAAMESALWELYLHSEHVGVDTETTGLDPFSCTLLNVGIANEHFAVSVEWETASVGTKNLVRAIMLDETIGKDFWNSAYDLQVFVANNIAIAGRIDDWMLAHQIIAPRISHKLTHASCFEFHVSRWKTVFHGDGGGGGTDFAKTDPYERALYNGRDTHVTWAFAKPFNEYLTETFNGHALYQNALKNAVIARKMQLNGVKINRERWQERFEDCTQKFTEATARLKRICAKVGIEDYNPRSHKQTARLFGEILEVTVGFNKKGKASYDKKALEDLCAYPDERVRIVARAMLDQRAAKRKLDYLRVLNVPYAHPGWRPGKAKTGRWASTSPNLMNIPKPIKDPQTKEIVDPGLRVIFEARPGNFLVEADYSAVEGRILALIVGDKTLLEWFRTGVDIHVRTAALLLRKPDSEVTKEERENAKGVRYAFHYGSTPETAWRQLVVKQKGLTLKMVEVLFDGLRKLHPEITAHHTNIVAFAKLHDHVEDALSGRRYHFHGQVDRNQCLNLPIQTFASSLIDRALQRVVERLNPDEKVLMQVHDSLLLEGPDWRRLYTILQEEMERAVLIKGNEFSFAIECKYGTNWGALKVIN